MLLGKKRNLLHKKAKGDILVYMDDDDYYPPDRVSHAVSMLLSHPKALCAGTSEIYIYFKHINQMIQFGPYGPNHATAGTFAFRRELLKDHLYKDTAALAEEKGFLQDYTVPFVQLEPKKTILVFSHEHNTFDKKTLLENRHPQFVKDSDKVVDDFIKEEDLKEFYMNEIEDLLKDYEAGRPDMKPDVLKQIEEIKIEREEMMRKHQEQMMQQMPQNPQMMQQMPQNLQMMQQVQQNPQMMQQLQQNPQMMQQMIQQTQELIHQNQHLIQQQQQQGGCSQIMADINGKSTSLTNDQVVQILKQQQDAIKQLTVENETKNKMIQSLLEKINQNS